MSDNIYKFKPFVFEKHQYRVDNKVPKARSGHRIVTTNTDLYSFGGYNPDIENTDPELSTDTEWLTTRPLFRELWKYSFITREWTRLPISDNTPKELASHCATIIDHKYLLIYGGTGFPFGHTSSNKLFILNVNTNQWKQLVPKNTDENDLPIEQYGQALATDDDYNLYVVGGTTGYNYTIDVHKFDLKTCLWHRLYKKTNFWDEFPGERYRHEMAFYDNKLYVLGGGTSNVCYSLAVISIFDTQTQKWTESATKFDINSMSDETYGYPHHRKCHDCIFLDNFLFVLGGTSGHQIFDDFWKLDLTSLQWTKLSVRIPRALYFHSASISPSGRLSIFGGVVHINHRERTNELFTVWLKIPTLKQMSFEAILFYMNRNRKTNKSINELLSEFGLTLNFVQNL